MSPAYCWAILIAVQMSRRREGRAAVAGPARYARSRQWHAVQASNACSELHEAFVQLERLQRLRLLDPAVKLAAVGQQLSAAV